MIVGDIFGTETPKLISLFFEKFDEIEEEEISGFVSMEEEDDQKIPEDVQGDDVDDEYDEKEKEDSPEKQKKEEKDLDEEEKQEN